MKIKDADPKVRIKSVIAGDGSVGNLFRFQESSPSSLLQFDNSLGNTIYATFVIPRGYFLFVRLGE
jgi:hypothetical protein